MGKKHKIQRSFVSQPVPITSAGIADVFDALASASGTAVNKQTVYALPALLHGVDLIASTMGRIDCAVFKETRDGTKARDKEHPADYLLMRRPNDWQTPFEFRREMAADAVMGNAYAYVARDEVTGKPSDLVILDPQKTWPVVVRYQDVGRMQVYYVTEIQGKQITLQADEVIHIKGRVRLDCGLVGRSLLDCARDILGLSIALIQYGSYYFQNSGLPSMIIEMPVFMKGKEQVEQFREGLDNQHRGITQAHKTMILQGGAKASRQQISNDQAQFLESRQMSLTDIALLVGLPGSFLGSKQNTSYGSLDQDALNLLVHTFSQWFCNFEQQFDRQLLTESEKVRGIRWIEFNKAQLLEADHESSVKTWVELVNNGLCLPNVAAAALNLPPLDEDYNRPRLPTTIGIQLDEDEQAEADAQDLATAQASKPDPVQPQADDKQQPPDKTAERLAALTGAVIARYVNRLQKAAEVAGKKDERLDLSSHRDILIESIAPVCLEAERMADQLLDGLEAELGAVTRDQQAAACGRIEAATWTRKVLS
jgi:HK97 family phage portal protein